jgi:hypothetical protein
VCGKHDFNGVLGAHGGLVWKDAPGEQDSKSGQARPGWHELVQM